MVRSGKEEANTVMRGMEGDRKWIGGRKGEGDRTEEGWRDRGGGGMWIRYDRWNEGRERRRGGRDSGL